LCRPAPLINTQLPPVFVCAGQNPYYFKGRRIRSGIQLTENEIEQAAIEGAVQRAAALSWWQPSNFEPVPNATGKGKG
jgi:hypothetical protein